MCSTRPGARDEALDLGAPRPLADDDEPRVRQPRRRQPPRRDEAVDVLVPLEHADEERRRPLRQRLDRGPVKSERSL